MFTQIRDVLIKLAVLIFVLFANCNYAKDLTSSDYYGRNDINNIEAGNYSTNIISQDGSTVFVFHGEDDKKKIYAQEIIKEMRKEGRWLADAAMRLPEKEGSIIEKLALAEYVFDMGQYSLSASLYEDVLKMFSLDDIGYNYVEGMTQASYYGSGRHIQGLDFICRQYESRPMWSHRFRHDVHAHLRGLTKKFGHDYARNVLHKLKEKSRCQRDDFSEIWIPIDLYDMRALEAGKHPHEVSYGFLDAEDRAYADRLISEGNHKFLDYLYFIKGDYEAVINKFKKSYLKDVALLGFGLDNKNQAGFNALKLYLKQYGESNLQNSRYVIDYLIKNSKNELISDNHIGEVLTEYKDLIVKVNSDSDSYSMRGLNAEQVMLAYELEYKCLNYERYFADLNFYKLSASIEDLFKKIDRLFTGSDRGQMNALMMKKLNNYCGIGSSIFSKEFANILSQGNASIESGNWDYIYKLAMDIKACGDNLDFKGKKVLSPDRKKLCNLMYSVFNRASYHRLASKFLEKVYDFNREKYHEALFFGALSDKRIHEYGRYATKMEQYTRNHPSERYSDDALTELGWYYLAVQLNPKKADAYFEQVITLYRNTNSLDNALNWLVISKRDQGKYDESLSYAAQLGKYITSNRLLNKIAGRYEKLRQVADNFDAMSADISIGNGWYELSDGWAIRSKPQATVKRNKLNARNVLDVGSVIVALNNIEVYDSVDFYEKLFNLINEGEEKVKIIYTSSESYRDKYAYYKEDITYYSVVINVAAFNSRSKKDKQSRVGTVFHSSPAMSFLSKPELVHVR